MGQSIEPHFPRDLLTGERERKGGEREREREKMNSGAEGEIKDAYTHLLRRSHN